MKWINQTHWIHLRAFCQQLTGILLFSLVSDHLSSPLAAGNTGDTNTNIANTIINNITNITITTTMHCCLLLPVLLNSYSRQCVLENNEVAGTESLIWQNSHAISSSIEILGNPCIFTFLPLVVRTNYRILCRILSLQNMYNAFDFLLSEYPLKLSIKLSLL